MAGSLFSILTDSGSLSIVDERNNSRRWASLVVEEVLIKTPSEVTDLPFENSNLSSESLTMERLQEDLRAGKVLTPANITVKAVAPDISLVESILQCYEDLEHTLTISTKGIFAQNMVLTSLAITQDAENLSSTPMELFFEQAGMMDEEGFDPRQEGDKKEYGVQVHPNDGLITSVEGFYNKISKNIGI